MGAINELIRANLESLQSRLFTSLPGKVLEVKSDEECTTVDVQLLVNHVSGDHYAQQETIRTDLPVFYPSGGGAAILLPLKKGDIVEVRFGNRFMGDFFNSDGTKPVTPSFPRYHSIDNGWVVPGGATYKTGYKQEDDKLVIRYKDVDITIDDQGEINLGGSGAERLVLGDSFLTAFAGHTHTDSQGGQTTALFIPDGQGGQTPVTELAQVEQYLSTRSKTE